MEELKLQILISKELMKKTAEDRELNSLQKQYIEGQVKTFEYVLDLIDIINDKDKYQ